MQIWTEITDLYYEGVRKHEKDKYYIQLSKEDTVLFFKKRFGIDLEEGEFYSLSIDSDLSQLTAYERGCEAQLVNGTFQGYIEKPRGSGATVYLTLEEYLKKDDIAVIYADDISPDELFGPELSLMAEIAIETSLKKARLEKLRIQIDEALVLKNFDILKQIHNEFDVLKREFSEK